MSDFEGKVALVTGGGQGLGATVCEELARNGATVAVTDIALANAQAVADRIADAGGSARAFQCDVSDWGRMEAVTDEVESTLGPIDVLVCNAGVSQSIHFLDISEKDWDRVIDINLKGLFITLRTVVPKMVRRRRGRVVYVGSISSKVAYPRFAHYNASKFGGLGLAQTVAAEVAQHNITVNTVCPGVMDTPMQRDLVRQMVEENDEFETVEQAEKWFDDMLPLGAPQPVEDVASMVLYLASEKARHITGASFHVDGGIAPR
jgi:meso-butanediol dehydrogenase / (S,S)-butanediol dehydrogenase / diacetyl reductase